MELLALLSAMELPTLLQASSALIVGFFLWTLATMAIARASRRGKPLPGPPRHWLLGNVPLVAAVVGPGGHIDTLVRQLAKEHGKLFSLNLLAFDFVAVLDPDLVREVVITKAYPKSPTYSALFPFIGTESMLVAGDAVWHRQRRAYTPAFSYAFLKTLVPAFMDKGRTLMDRFQGFAESGETVKMLDDLKLVTLDIICQVAMNKNYHFMDSEKPPPILICFLKLLDITAYYASSPHMKFFRKLPWNAWRINSLQNKYNGLILEVVRERLADVAAAKKLQGATAAGGVTVTAHAGSGAAAVAGKAVDESPKDILAMAIQTAMDDGGALNEQEILSQVKTFLFAGHDTTASTLAFAVYELCCYPEVEAKVVAELKEVGAWERAKAGTLTSEDLSALKYMGLVVKEVLRMWPAGGTARMAPLGSTLQGFDIGRKILYIPHAVLHRDHELWGESGDTFRPERWLDEAYVSALHPLAYQPFSKGPRDCIGQTFALLEAKAIIAMMYARFTFRYVGEKPEEQGYMITSFPKFHVPVKISVRDS